MTFLGESEGSLPYPHDSLPDAGEAIDDFWSMSGSFIYRHHVEPRVKPYSPREESFPIPLKYIDVSRTTHPNLDVKKRSALMIIGTLMAFETCQIRGQVSHNLLSWKKKLPMDICGPGERLTRKQLTSRPDHLWPELWKSMGKNAKLKEKQKWSEEKIHLDNARKLRGILFHRPRGIRNSQKPSRTRVRSWKHQLLLRCPVKS